MQASLLYAGGVLEPVARCNEECARSMVIDRCADHGCARLPAGSAATRQTRRSREFRALPACNPAGNAEITAGGNNPPDNEGGRIGELILQDQTLFRLFQTGGCGIGIAAGAVHRRDDR
jgi:hypothetical protein